MSDRQTRCPWSDEGDHEPAELGPLSPLSAHVFVRPIVPSMILVGRPMEPYELLLCKHCLTVFAMPQGECMRLEYELIKNPRTENPP